MAINLKINIFIQPSAISNTLILGPSEEPEKSPREELLKKLRWPYNYSSESALLPGYTPLTGPITNS